MAADVEKRVAELTAITDARRLHLQWRGTAREYLVLWHRLRQIEAERMLEGRRTALASTEAQLVAQRAAHATLQTRAATLSEQEREAHVAYLSHAVIQRQTELQRLQTEIQRQAREIEARWAGLRRSLQEQASPLVRAAEVDALLPDERDACRA